jgi:hypothetical protein
MKMQGIDKILLVICISLAIIISAPAFAGYWFQPDGYLYTGFDWQDDFHLYASYIKQSSESPKIFMENRYTTEPQKGVYVFLYFSLLGTISNLTGISTPAIFNIGRIAVISIFLFVLWLFLKNFFTNEKERIIAFFICSIGGGIGWLFFILGNFFPVFGKISSTDINYSLGYSTFGHLAFPLPYIAYSLFIIVFILLKKYFENQNLKFLVAALMAYAGIFFIHPASIAVFSLCLALIPAMPIMQSFDIQRAWKYFKTMLVFVLPAGLIIVYLLFALSDYAYSKSFEAYMNWKRAEPLFYYFIGYGLLIPLAFFGIRKINEIKGFTKDFFYAWLLGSFIAAINPDKGIKLMFALHLPIAIAASFGIFYLKETIGNKKFHLSFLQGTKINISKAFTTILIIMVCLSAPFIIAKRTADVANPGFQSGPYMKKSDYEAIQFLAKQEKGNVVSSYKIGNNIPYMTHHKSYLGHWTETSNLAEKKAIVNELFSDNTSEEKKMKILFENNIDYVFFGENEKNIGNSLPKSVLEEIYSYEGTKIYKVKK